MIPPPPQRDVNFKNKHFKQLHGQHVNKVKTSNGFALLKAMSVDMIIQKGIRCIILQGGGELFFL